MKREKQNKNKCISTIKINKLPKFNKFFIFFILNLAKRFINKQQETKIDEYSRSEDLQQLNTYGLLVKNLFSDLSFL